MKTNVTLQSADRELFGIIVRQDTKGEFLSLTDLQKAYETARWQHGWSERKIETVTQTNTFRERLFYTLENQGVIETDIRAFIKTLETDGFTRTMKKLGVWKSTGARGTNQVMCDPYIWILIALEMNPMIYAKVVVWLTDSLIFNRIEAGGDYLPMNRAIRSLLGNDADYSKYARTINEKVFGRHERGMRNLASSDQLKKISDIERFVTQSLEMKYIKSDEDISLAIQKFKV